MLRRARWTRLRGNCDARDLHLACDPPALPAPDVRHARDESEGRGARNSPLDRGAADGRGMPRLALTLAPKRQRLTPPPPCPHRFHVAAVAACFAARRAAALAAARPARARSMG